jgi:hypothetical protein
MGIEEFLDLNKDEIKRRKEELRKNIRTYPGTSYLEVRLKIFKIQPWPFISYLAHYDPKLLNEAFSCYKDYDGAESVEAIKEQLREEYIMFELMQDIEKEQKKK